MRFPEKQEELGGLAEYLRETTEWNVLLTHPDGFGVSCSVSEMSDVDVLPFSQYDGTNWHFALCYPKYSPKKYI